MKARLYIEPKTTVISNPAVNFGASHGTHRYIGEVTSFERRVRFGREMPCPWQKEYVCRAVDEVAAFQLLSALAKRDGYALGGVHNIRKVEP